MKCLLAVAGIYLFGAATLAHADPKIALHVTEAVQQYLCSRTIAPWSLPCSEFTTSGLTKHGYNVYVVAAGADSGIEGMSFGIEYNAENGKGIDVFSNWWCSTGLPFTLAGPSGLDFPASGSSVTATYYPCADTSRNSVSAGLYLYAYSADVLSILPNLNRQVPDFFIQNCAQQRFDFPADPRAAVRFSDLGNVLGFNPCTGEGTPAPPPGQNPPPPPPLPIPDQDAGLYLHIGAIDSNPLCRIVPTTVANVVTSAPAPAPGDSSLYPVYLLASPKVSGGYMQAFKAARFGIQYDDVEGDHGLSVVSWTACGYLNFPTDKWPASGSGGSFVMSEECVDSLMVVVGFFWVQVHGPSTMQFIGYPYTYPADHTIQIATCPNHVYEYETLPQDRCGWISVGGAAIGVDTDGCNPMLGPCGPGPTPTILTTWGKIKSRYIH